VYCGFWRCEQCVGFGGYGFDGCFGGCVCGREEKLMAPEAESLYGVLEFPKHLQTTVLTLLRLGRATATEVSECTGKARAVENAYPNQLVVMKIARKERVNRKVVFQREFGGFGLVEKCGCGRDTNVFEADRAECVDCYLRRVKH
jgi:hypothetical protein